MNPQMIDMINRAWDEEVDNPTRDIRAMPDSVVAAQLGIPKWKVIAARQGYERPARKKKSDVRTVLDSGFCSTVFRYVEIRMPRVSILEAV